MASHSSSEGGGDKKSPQHGEKLLQDPLALAAALRQVQHHESPSIISSLPPEVRRRVNALKKLQLDGVNIEAEFYRNVHELECQYAERFLPLIEKRKSIVSGAYEPTDEECKLPIVDEDALAEELETKAVVENGPADQKGSVQSGVPEFWPNTLKNVEIIAEMIQEHDEPILNHLVHVEVKTLKEPMMFTLYFHFSPNEFFTNTTLTKEYFLKCEPDPKDPFSFDGPEIINCKGCKIDWKPNKNVTVKLMKKKQKHKQKGATRFVTKEIKNDSFFNFFDPPVIPLEGEEALDDETRELLNADFEIGQILRDRVLPHAVLYFTGEAQDEDDMYEEDEDEEEEEDDMEDEQSDEDSCMPKSNAKSEKPAECKQQ